MKLVTTGTFSFWFDSQEYFSDEATPTDVVANQAIRDLSKSLNKQGWSVSFLPSLTQPEEQETPMDTIKLLTPAEFDEKHKTKDRCQQYLSQLQKAVAGYLEHGNLDIHLDIPPNHLRPKVYASLVQWLSDGGWRISQLSTSAGLWSFTLVPKDE